MSKSFLIKSVDDYTAPARYIIEELPQLRKFAMHGEMGAGKTTFVSVFCSLLECREQTDSPTYSLINEYSYPQGLVHHADLYRLENLDEIYDIGLEDYLYDSDYLFVEWSEKAEKWLAETCTDIFISRTENNERLLVIKV